MNDKINRILACVDFSEYSLMVLEYALELAKNSNAQIVIYNVINIRNINSLEMGMGFFPIAYANTINAEEYVKELKKERQGQIKEIIKENFFQAKSMMSFIIDVGIPSEQILEIIKKEDIDLVVMANKGRGNMSKFFFGSAAEKVFRHSPVPVVSVRDRKKFKRGE